MPENEVLVFIKDQLVRIEDKMDKVDGRLRDVERELVNKRELERISERVTVLETFKVRFVCYASIAIVIIQFFVHVALRKLNL